MDKDRIKLFATESPWVCDYYDFDLATLNTTQENLEGETIATRPSYENTPIVHSDGINGPDAIPTAESREQFGRNVGSVSMQRVTCRHKIHLNQIIATIWTQIEIAGLGETQSGDDVGMTDKV